MTSRKSRDEISRLNFQDFKIYIKRVAAEFDHVTGYDRINAADPINHIIHHKR